MDDLLAVSVAIAAAIWLIRTCIRRTLVPPCGAGDAPAGTDGFVPLEGLRMPAMKKPGRP